MVDGESIAKFIEIDDNRKIVCREGLWDEDELKSVQCLHPNHFVGVRTNHPNQQNYNTNHLCDEDDSILGACCYIWIVVKPISIALINLWRNSAIGT